TAALSRSTTANFTVADESRYHISPLIGTQLAERFGGRSAGCDRCRERSGDTGRLQPARRPETGQGAGGRRRAKDGHHLAACRDLDPFVGTRTADPLARVLTQLSRYGRRVRSSASRSTS